MTKIAASIEVAARQAIESQDLPGLFPAGTRVYITDMGTDSVDTLTSAAKRIHDLGYKPVPHFASRRLSTKAALETRIRRAAEEAGVTDILVIGGGLERQAGEFSSTMEVLETGFFDKYGITEMGVAGHPEGSPEFSEAVAIEALRLKKNFGERTGAKLRVVTQFGFDADRFIRYSESLREHGVDLPVHLGVAGPAKITTLIKYAAMCGVGNSISFLKKNALSLDSARNQPLAGRRRWPDRTAYNCQPGICHQTDSHLPVRRSEKVVGVACRPWLLGGTQRFPYICKCSSQLRNFE